LQLLQEAVRINAGDADGKMKKGEFVQFDCDNENTRRKE